MNTEEQIRAAYQRYCKGLTTIDELDVEVEYIRDNCGLPGNEWRELHDRVEKEFLS